MNLTKIRNIAGVALLAILAACSGTGSCPPNGSNGELSLKIEAPAQYPAGIELDAQLTIINTSSNVASNLSYSVPQPGSAGNYTGVTIIPNAGVGSQSGDCSTLYPNVPCTFMAHIPAGSTPGSFTVTAVPNSKSGLVGKVLNYTKSVLSSDSISVTANLGLVDIPAAYDTNRLILLPISQNMPVSAGKSNYAYISLWVKNNLDGFNQIKLDDGTGKLLESANYQLIGTASYSTNSVLTYKVLVTPGIEIESIGAQGYKDGNLVCSNSALVLNKVGEFTNCSNIANINTSPSNLGLLSVQPSYSVMTDSYKQQIITIQNIGGGKVSNIQLPNVSIPFSIGVLPDGVTECQNGMSLFTSETCSVALVYGNASIESDYLYNVSYNNGSGLSNVTSTLHYKSNNSGVLVASPKYVLLDSVNQESTITLTNTGSDIINNLLMPSNLNYVVQESTTCTSQLSAGSSCTYTIGYNESHAHGTEQISFTYSYQNQNQSTNVDVETIALVPYAYLSGGSDVVDQCLVNSQNGNLIACNTQTIESQTEMTHVVTFEVVNGVKYVYIPYDYGGLVKCSVDKYGQFNNCVMAFDNPDLYNGQYYYSIQFATVNGTRYAYAVDGYQYGPTSQPEVYRCTIESNGQLSNCEMNNLCGVGNGGCTVDAYQIKFYTVNGTQYAYLTDTDGSIKQYQLGVDGFFTASSNANPTNINSAYGISFYNGNAYVGIPDSNICSINSITGLFDVCSQLYPSLLSGSYVYNFAFAKFGGVEYSYPSLAEDVVTNGIYKCTVNVDGTFSNCVSTKPTPDISHSVDNYGITFAWFEPQP